MATTIATVTGLEHTLQADYLYLKAYEQLFLKSELVRLKQSYVSSFTIS